MKKAKNPNVVVGDYKRPLLGFLKRPKPTADKMGKPSIESELAVPNQTPKVGEVKMGTRLRGGVSGLIANLAGLLKRIPKKVRLVIIVTIGLLVLIGGWTAYHNYQNRVVVACNDSTLQKAAP